MNVWSADKYIHDKHKKNYQNGHEKWCDTTDGNIKQKRKSIYEVITWIKGPSSSMSKSVCMLLSSIENNDTLSKECSGKMKEN